VNGPRDWLRRAAEGQVSSPAPRLHWCEVCQVAAELSGPRGRAPDPSPRPGDLPRRLDGAIAAVHRSEQARLLVEASALRVKATEDAGVGLAPLVLGLGVAEGCGEGHGRSRPDPLARVREELDLARADGVEVPLELVACSLWPPRLWGRGSGEALARAALVLDPSPEVHLAWVRALVARGRPGAALVELESLAVLRTRDPVQERAGFRQAVDLTRAAAFERRGDLSATLAGLDRVGEAGWPRAPLFPDGEAVGAPGTPESGWMGDAPVAPASATSSGDLLFLETLTLALALLLGDPGVAERALLRMRPVGGPPRVGWEACLQRALTRWRAALRGGRDGQASSGLPDASAGVVFRLLAAADPVSARVALLAIGA